LTETAIILAAGFGSRLGGLTDKIPKGFLEIGNSSLINRSVECLLRNGINKIYIGTGYLSEHYEEYASHFPGLISCVKNERFANTSSMDTLYNFRNIINQDFLLLESDLLYEDRALSSLIESDQQNIVLASGRTSSGDEVYINADGRGALLSMTKDKSAADCAFGELVGISKVSIKSYQDMCMIFRRQGPLDIDYEYVMTYVKKPNNFIVHKIDDLAWCEIDDKKHLKRAKGMVIKAIDAANDLYRHQ